MKKPLIILTGPTAVGKTELSVSLAHQIHGSVISADSMQIYRHMDIGSAKIKKEEMQGIPHYLVDILEPDQEFHVVRFQEYAKHAMEEIYAKGRLPIVVGGTGFYIQALLYDIDFSMEISDFQSGDDSAASVQSPMEDCSFATAPKERDYRSRLEQTAREQGPHVLHEMLAEVDPESATAIHENNVKRVIRALEFYHLSGKKISEHNKQERLRESPYQFVYFVLNDDRDRLYERIDRRVDLMLEEGLIEEVQNLKRMGYEKHMVSMQGLGYKEILDYLDGSCTLEEAVYRIKRDTRHFAKRQLTWFRREREVTWIQKPDFDYDNHKILSFITEELKKKQIIQPD